MGGGRGTEDGVRYVCSSQLQGKKGAPPSTTQLSSTRSTMHPLENAFPTPAQQQGPLNIFSQPLWRRVNELKGGYL